MKLYEKDVTPTYPKLSDAEHIFLNESPFGIFHWREKCISEESKSTKRL